MDLSQVDHVPVAIPENQYDFLIEVLPPIISDTSSILCTQTWSSKNTDRDLTLLCVTDKNRQTSRNAKTFIT